MKDTMSERVVLCNGERIRYTLIRKQVKNINLHMKSDGSIWVSANRRVPADYIDKFVQSKGDTLLLERKKLLESKNSEMPTTYEDGEMITYLGEKYLLRVIKDQNERVELDEGFLLIYARNQEDQLRKSKLVSRWLQEQQKVVFPPICDKMYQLLKEYDIVYPIIKTRKMKSIWGSCQTQTGVITLNTRLLHKPVPCIEYVILHEFVHLIHPNHSKEFYGVIERYLPNWRERRRTLKDFQVK